MDVRVCFLFNPKFSFKLFIYSHVEEILYYFYTGTYNELFIVVNNLNQCLQHVCLMVISKIVSSMEVFYNFKPTTLFNL